MTLTRTWYGENVRKLHLDYHQPPWMHEVGAAVTPEYARKLARMFREAGVQVVEIFALDHHGFCFYPTEYGVPHPGLAVDYTGTMVRALRNEGIRPIAYMNVFTSIHLHETHPDWVVTSPDGNQPRGAWLQFEASGMCPSSPYLQDYFLPQLREVIERFDVDAVWLDSGSWLVETLCACAYCQEQFRSSTGLELPTSVPERPRHDFPARNWSPTGMTESQSWSTRDDAGEDETWVGWRIWRRGQIQTYLDAVSGEARAVKPSILIGDNSTGRWSRPHVLTEHGRFSRWLTPRDTGVDYLTCDPVPMGGNHAVILSREARYQATTGVPFDYMNERFNKWGEWQLRSPIDHKLEFATILALGGTCFFADQPYPDGSLEPAVYDQLQETYAFVAAREPHVLDTELVPDVAILASAPSQLFGPLGNGRDAGRERGLVGGDTSIGDRTDRVEGAHLISVELGLHCLIYDEPTLRGHLGEQSLVIVPEQCLLEEATIEALHHYVAGGGGLLVTGRSGWWNEQAVPRNGTQLYDLLGVEIQRELPSPVHFLRLQESFREGSAMPDLPLQCWGSAVEVRLAGAHMLGELIGPRSDVWRDGVQDEDHWQHYTTVGCCPPGMNPVAPGITMHEVGNGRAAYLAVDPFAAYNYEGHRLTRLMLQYLLDLVTPPDRRRITVQKPLHVEVALQRQGDRLIVHLLNYFAQKRNAVLVNNEELLPVSDIEVSVQTDVPPHGVMLQPDGMEPVWSYQDGRTVISLPRLEIHAMIVIELRGNRDVVGGSG